MAIIGSKAQAYTFYDAKQQSAQLRLFIADDSGSTLHDYTDGFNIGVDLAALSNSSVAGDGAIRGHGAYTSDPNPVSPGAASTYLDVADKAVFVFQDSVGTLHKYQVPNPKSTIFLADQETIDFTVTAVKQFVADMTHATFSGTAPTVSSTNPVVSRSAVPLASSVGGYRRRGKTPRKFNIFTRNPALSGQGE